jgi:hypothetical protein
MDHVRDLVPLSCRSRQFQDLAVAAGQAALLPAHAFAGRNVKMAARRGQVLTDVEDRPAAAALRQQTLEATLGISIPSPMDLPGHLIQNFKRVHSRFHVLKLPQSTQRGLHRLGVTAVLPETGIELVGAVQGVAQHGLQRLRLFE